ncbi:M15 family metallopeptidase [Clostridium gasigenes]|uniref:D-alanyl-D-alanine carboxypeptidase n=1 Tax=Clostridium gasigenes TaxID=94869 RepID=A0A1H0Q783_9CLOT|nr:M15 family metallopeptidase [Clostridium gasigenes]MBB6623316.1 M15 family metallopeptidase [Clostridium gasigenes]MBU3088059.1 M15 family metallopeptidase [Clostridium gasigenes]SDP13194.1 D-alanyl-D-alanine carboxypeptidase [Clostridium gasigenes]
MKKGFKKILVFSVIIICGFWYMLGNTVLELGDTRIKGINISLNDKDKLVQATGVNGREELMLVNRKYGLDKNYIPEGLSIPNISFSDIAEDEEKHVAGIIVESIEELVSAAKEDGIILLGNSGYRSYKSQKNIYKNRVKSQGKKLADVYVAKSGFSEHQTGLCIDITNKEGYFAEGTKEADWLAKNCYRFGFIIRYPKEKKSITSIEYEPWHIRYVGEDAAKYIYDNGITLEEYLGK